MEARQQLELTNSRSYWSWLAVCLAALFSLGVQADIQPDKARAMSIGNLTVAESFGAQTSELVGQLCDALTSSNERDSLAETIYYKKGKHGIPLAIWLAVNQCELGLAAILEAGADPNATDEIIGGNVTWWAARVGSVQTLKILLDNGGKVGHVTKGRSTLENALLSRRWDNVLFLAGSVNKAHWAIGDEDDMFVYSITQSRFDITIELINRGYEYDWGSLASMAKAVRLDEHTFEYQKRDELLLRLNVLMGKK